MYYSTNTQREVDKRRNVCMSSLEEKLGGLTCHAICLWVFNKGNWFPRKVWRIKITYANENIQTGMSEYDNWIDISFGIIYS